MTYKTNPRDYALQLVEEGIVSPQKMLLAALWEMSYDEIDVMLDWMEMSPRFNLGPQVPRRGRRG